MDINYRKNQHNLRYFNLIFLFKFITHCDIKEYCIVGLKSIYSNIKFFIFQLICILAKMVITFEPVGFFFMRFSMLYLEEQVLSFKPCL